MGAGQVGIRGESERDDEKTTFTAEIKVVGRRLETLGKGFMCNQDNLSSESFRFCADGFLCFTDEWGDKNATVGCRVEPSFFLICELD